MEYLDIDAGRNCKNIFRSILPKLMFVAFLVILLCIELTVRLFLQAYIF